MGKNFNIGKKKLEVEQLFNDTLALCKQMVKDAKQGKAVLRGSSLREINQFLKFAQDYLSKKRIEQEQEANLEAELQAEQAFHKEAPDFDDDDDGIPKDVPKFDDEDSQRDFEDEPLEAGQEVTQEADQGANPQSLPLEFN